MSEENFSIDINAHFEKLELEEKERRKKNMPNILDKLDGYKTYIVAIAMICYAVGGFIAQKISLNEAITTGLAALALMGVRNSTAKVDEKLTSIMNLGK